MRGLQSRRVRPVPTVLAKGIFGMSIGERTDSDAIVVGQGMPRAFDIILEQLCRPLSLLTCLAIGSCSPYTEPLLGRGEYEIRLPAEGGIGDGLLRVELHLASIAGRSLPALGVDAAVARVPLRLAKGQHQLEVFQVSADARARVWIWRRAGKALVALVADGARLAHGIV